MKLIVFDTETTCLNNPDVEIWQFSGYKIDLETKEKTEFDYSWKTKHPLSYFARCRCSIIQEEVDKFPECDVSKIYETLELDNDNIYYAGHNISFDMSVVKTVLEREYNKFPCKNLKDKSKWIDTYSLVGRVYADEIQEDIGDKLPLVHTLSNLFHYFHLYKEDEKLDFHSALFDVEITWRLLRFLTKKLELNILTDVKTLAELSNSPYELTYFNFGKYKGQKIKDVYTEDKGYFRWLSMNCDMLDPKSESFNNNLAYTVSLLRG